MGSRPWPRGVDAPVHDEGKEEEEEGDSATRWSMTTTTLPVATLFVFAVISV